MKKILALLLTLTMLLTLSIPLASAAEATPDGTAVRSAAALKRMDIEGTYYLANDIVIHGSWRMDEFRGVLDGNGHTVYFDHASVAGGLFAKLGGKENSTAIIKNLNIVQLEEVTFTAANEGIGGLAGSVDLGTAYVENVKVYANITTDADGIGFGGFVGDARYGALMMKRCVFMGSLTHTLGNASADPHKIAVGGMLGKTWSVFSPLHLIECVNYGDISAYARVGGMFGYDYPKSDTECIGELVIDKCVNYGTITGSFDNETDNGAGGMLGHHIAHANSTTQLSHNVNFGDVRCNVANVLGSIAGQIQVKRAVQDATTFKIYGNVNYGTVKTISGTGNGSGMVGFYRTTTGGGISGHSQRVHNYHNDGLTDYVTPEEFGQKENHRFSGTAFTDNGATFAALNAAYPDVYAQTTDGKITLKWVADAGYTADYEINIPTLEEIETAGSSVDKTMALTLDVSIPEATGTAITTAEELAAMASDGIYYLANDILITDEFTSVSDFSGVLHGNGHAIVLNGAEIRGGLFRNLAGGKIYDLSITEERTNDPQENAFRGFAMNADTLCMGTLAAYGYGTIVNVTVDCAVGSALKYTANAYVGGLIGVLTEGDSVIYNCRNLAKVQGGNAGGLIGLLNGGEGKIEIGRCANWGEVISSVGPAGGVIGMHNASTLRLLVLENVNYGSVSASDFVCSGGIIGVHKNLWDGVAFFLNNINYGKITCNFVDEGADLGCPGGIIGALDADSYEGATVSGNVNYGEVIGNNAPNQLVGISLNNDGMTTAENNFAVAGEVAATVGAIAGDVVDAGTLNALNATYANTYALQGEQIGLKWAADMGLSSTVPTVQYSFGNDGGSDSGEENQTGEQQTSSNDGTSEPSTTKKGGCKGVISGFGFVMMLTVACAACLLVEKKKITVGMKK